MRRIYIIDPLGLSGLVQAGIRRKLSAEQGLGRQLTTAGEDGRGATVDLLLGLELERHLDKDLTPLTEVENDVVPVGRKEWPRTAGRHRPLVGQVCADQGQRPAAILGADGTGQIEGRG